MSNNQRKLQGSQFRARSEKAYRPERGGNINKQGLRNAIDREGSTGGNGMGCVILMGMGLLGTGIVVAVALQEVIK
jgi:hypothetical protein